MLRIYFRFKSQYLKTAMEYRLNFWMMVFSGLLMRTLIMAVPYVLFRNIPVIAGFAEAEVYLILSFMFISEGFCNVFLDGIWYITGLVFTGQFDVMLSRPVSPLFQILSYEIGLHGLGVLVLGFSLMVFSLISLGWLSVGSLLLCLLFAACGIIVRASTSLISCCGIFWFNLGSHANLPYAAHSIGEYARYPISVYPLWMRIILLFVIPFGFIGYVPVLLLRGQQPFLWGPLLGIVTAGIALLARTVFYRGTRKYESVGM